MLKEVFRSRMFLGVLLFFVLIVVGGVVYLRYVERETAEDSAGTQEGMKSLVEAQKSTPEVPVGDTSQGGHFATDGTWPEGAHEPVETPAAPAPYFSDAELAEIPEDVPEPDIPLPADLSDSKTLNRWTEKFTAEWLKYTHALDLPLKRLTAEINQMTAELPPENAPEFAAAKAKLLAKEREHYELGVEKNARIHKAAAASQAFADAVTKWVNRK